MEKNWCKNILLDVNGRIQAVGIDDAQPTFHYMTEGYESGTVITAYELVVYDEEGNVWDTGKCPCTDAPYILYRGETLREKHTYFVKIRLWNEADVESEYSDPVMFETGFLGHKWEAAWIEPVQGPAYREKDLALFEMFQPTPDFYNGEERLKNAKDIAKQIVVEKKLKKARAYVSAHGIYNLYINGNKISDHRLAPETSAYQKRLYYQTYDVTTAFEQGANTLALILADGWWIGRLGITGVSCNYGDRLGCIVQVELEYTDGSCEVIGSDESFCCKDSHVKYADLYIGEKWDLQHGDTAWMKDPDAVSDWEHCIVTEECTDVLHGQPLDAICVTDELQAVSIKETGANELLVDFGQVATGVVKIEIEAGDGQEISLEHGEVLELDGSFKHNIIGRNKNQKDELICKNDINVFEPQFTYHGCRYVRLTGATKDQIKAITFEVIGSQIQQTGQFWCSDKRLNQLQSNILWSTKGNMTSVPTDCPQREKLGWTGDLQVFAETGCFDFDLRAFLKSWLENLRFEQYENGEVPIVIPNFPGQERLQISMSGTNSSAAWSDAVIFVPYAMYQAYGDIQVLQDNYEAMEKWLGFVESICKKEPEGYAQFTAEEKERNQYLFTKCYHFGDWLIPSLRELPNGVPLGTEKTAAVVGACYYALEIMKMIEICQVLGKSEQAAEYEVLLGKIRQAISDEFVAEDGTVYACELQGLYVMILAADAALDGKKEKVLQKLVALIEANGKCLDTGFSSVKFLLDVLYDNGYQKLAYDLLFQTKAPSWLYMVEQGATTIWENWKAIKEDGTRTDSSYNHYAFGCVGDWIYRHIGGIQCIEPGYRKVRIAPDMNCGLREAQCSLKSPYGLIDVHWKKDECGICVEGRIPAGVQGVLEIGDTCVTLSSGEFREQL